MKKPMRLNQQLLITLIVIIVGSIVAFGLILPISIRVFFDDEVYDMLIEEQRKLINIENNHPELGYGEVDYHWLDSRESEIYNLSYNEENKLIINESDEDLLHQTLMYKDFFVNVEGMLKLEEKSKGTYKYICGDETIYYVINYEDDKGTLVSYKIDNTNQNLSHQLFMNILIIIVIVLTAILLSFFKWNARLINNLSNIQLKLDSIGEGNLKEVIETKNYTVEFQEVMNSLESMRKKLYENEQVKQGIIQNISHDLKTPLAVIKNYAEGIIDNVYPYGTVEGTAHVIYNQADRLQGRVQALLYLNRLEYIKSQKETYGEFDMRELLDEVSSYMKDIDGNIEIKFNLKESYFEGDIEKWRVVIENIIDNAKRYAKTHIIVNLQGNKFTIYNDGEHIIESDSGSLFNAFEVGKGGVNGLGLAIAKKTVEIYGYDIEFRNEVEGGVIFSIYKK